MTEDASADKASATWDQFGPEYDQPSYYGPVKTYAIASMPRSGSHMLGHMLWSTGSLGSPLEYIHPKHLATWQRLLGTASPADTIREVKSKRTSANGWFGFKAHWPHFDRTRHDDELMSELDVQSWIRITRRDVVSQAVSLVIARQTKAWISFHEASGEPVYDFESIQGAVDDLTKQEEAWDAYFRESGIDPLVVVYEDMLADQPGVVAAVARALGVRVPDSIPPSRTERQATSLNREWRERYLSEQEG
ncbi:Stf0 family sulfotransferase [Nocardioides sp. DS6]|uniref:Trehalose 2-sulfotransferase n=1 Tax=Nocardioides eburneus TaxID=3231482 RepID=A0ABV3STK4_9ACTN